MSIPAPLDAEATRESLDYFAARGFNQIDTAIMYQGGKSEAALGVLLSSSLRYKQLIVPISAQFFARFVPVRLTRTPSVSGKKKETRISALEFSVGLDGGGVLLVSVFFSFSLAGFCHFFFHSSRSVSECAVLSIPQQYMP